MIMPPALRPQIWCAGLKLFETVTVARKPDVKIARAFSDYNVTFNAAALPSGVHGQSMI